MGIIVVGGVVKKDNKYLLVQEAQEKCYGKCLEKMKNSGLMVYQNHSWKLTRRGMDIQNGHQLPMQIFHCVYRNK